MMLNLLNKLTLEAVKTAYKNRDEVTLKCMGLNIDDAKSLYELSSHDFEFVQEHHLNCIQIHVDFKSIQVALNKHHRKTQYDRIIEEAVKHGASYELMYKYTRLSRDGFRQLRKHFNVGNNRTVNLTDEEIIRLEKVLNASAITEKQPLSLDYLVAMAKASSLTITAIYNHIHENWWNKYEFK